MRETRADLDAQFWAIVERIEAGDPAYARPRPRPLNDQPQSSPENEKPLAS